MKNWKVELIAGGKPLAEGNIPRVIFQRDALSPLLFVVSMILPNHIFRKGIEGYKITHSLEKTNHWIYMDDIKLFAKYEKELETLIQALRIYSQDIGKQFGIEKIMRNWKRHEGIELPNQEKIRTLWKKETYNFLGNWVADFIKQVEIKKKNKKEKVRSTRKLLETKLYSGNIIKRIKI